MIITNEVKCWVNESRVIQLFISTTNHAKHIPPGYIGYVDYGGMVERSCSLFPDSRGIQEVPLPRGYLQPYLILAPIEDVQGFSLTSVSGTKVVGSREDPGMDFQIRINWEALCYREGRWHFVEQPVYLKHLGVKVEYPKHERSIITAALGYSPFMR